MCTSSSWLAIGVEGSHSTWQNLRLKGSEPKACGGWRFQPFLKESSSIGQKFGGASDSFFACDLSPSFCIFVVKLVLNGAKLTFCTLGVGEWGAFWQAPRCFIFFSDCCTGDSGK